MALETLTWLNLSFVEKILRKSEDDESIQMIDICLEPATSKGDNYTSDMIRITAEYSREQGCSIKEKISIILKILPELGSVRQKFVSCFNVYNISNLERKKKGKKKQKEKEKER